MPILKKSIYKLTSTPKTKHYIETGTYLGNGVEAVLGEYENIHSIELSEKWYQHNVERFQGHLNVKIYLGNSKIILPHLLHSIHEPVTIYLDAHYSGGTTAYGDEECPLLFELEFLHSRKYDDIIIIDDCRLLGNKGICGCEPNHPVYPTMNYDWSSITLDKIKDLLKDDYILLKNDKGLYTDGAPDQIVLVKKIQNSNIQP